ncbi:hypothetical protein AMK33_17805 [Streptomyces sp. CB02400]|nr:hypothetical protein AMK33_17805 [Streptomyces sp. CB02400]
MALAACDFLARVDPLVGRVHVRGGLDALHVEHVLARTKAWKILRDCRLKGGRVHTAMPGIARLHSLALTE